MWWSQDQEFLLNHQSIQMKIVHLLSEWNHRKYWTLEMEMMQTKEMEIMSMITDEVRWGDSTWGEAGL